jgi:hypothetical protein
MTEPEIVVRRCTVSVARRGGWSWGPDPQALPRRVVEALPGLLAERFAAELAGDADLEITEPVTVEVVISLDELVDGLDTGSIRYAGSPPVAAYPVEPAPAGYAEAGPDAGDPDPPPARRTPPEALAELAGRLAERGPGRLTERPRALLLGLGVHPDGQPTGGREPDHPEGAPAPSPDPADRAAEPTAPYARTGDPASTDPAVTRAARVSGEVEVRSALPFLAAAALARIGLLDAVGPALAQAGLDPTGAGGDSARVLPAEGRATDGPTTDGRTTDGLATDAQLFAAALAYKVLTPPRRGWLRTDADRADAAAFAGLAGDVPEAALSGLARRAPGGLPALTGLLGLSVCAGHEPGRPLVLTQPAPECGGGLLLVEPDGLFPVAWVDEAEELLPYWAACDHPPVLLAGRTVAAGNDRPAVGPVAVRHTRALVDADVPLVSDTAPSRGERWHRLAGAGPAVDLTLLTARLDEMVTELTRRRAVPLATGPAVERALTVTAGIALGTIAWLLWRHREPADPQLALARLGDLGGVVRYDRDAVRLRLPLGRRHTDLLEHGLLADVADVVWLGGRTLILAGG